MKFRLAILFLSLFMLMHKVSFGQDFFSNSSKSYQQTPNSAKLGEFGKYEVSPYSGQVDLKIPLNEFKYKDIVIPIALKYNTSGNKVNEHPSFVGLGWTLMAGGAITRIVKGKPDEISSQQIKYTIPNTLVPTEPGYYYRGKELYKEANWESKASIINYVGNSYPINNTDAEPDEFIFNFCGYSGSFYINPEGVATKKVVSSSPLVVDVIPELSSSDEEGFDAFNYDGDNLNPIDLGEKHFCTKVFRHFKSFTVILNNGDRYLFGGDYNTVEYSSSVINFETHDNSVLLSSPTSWMLKKIVRANGDVVSFEYARLGTPMVISDNYNYAGYKLVGSTIIGDAIDPEKRDVAFVNFQHPLYLKKIESADGFYKIEFNYSPSSQLTYTLRKEHNDILDPLKRCISKFYKINSEIINWSNYWMQLDEIVFNEKLRCRFNYTNHLNERLKLLSISNVDENNSTYGSYVFTYNTRLLPAYNTRKTDNWGYYNGKLYDASDIVCFYKYDINNLYNKRSSDIEYTQSEVLNNIKYPTGGVSIFEYELNDYSNYVNKYGKYELTKEIGKGGGLRIRKITNKDIDNNILDEVQYSYTNKNGVSSGILNGKPIYNAIGSIHEKAHSSGWSSWVYYNMSIDRKWDYYISSEHSLSSLTLSNLNAITYSRVEEIRKGNGKKIYYFDNNDSFIDTEPEFTETVGDGLLFFDACSSTALERGRQKRIETWNDNGDLVECVDFYYNNNAARYSNYLRAFSSAQYNFGAFLYRFSTYKIFTFNPFLEKKVTTKYNEGGIPTVIEEFYSYNADNLLSETIRKESNNQQVKQKKRYLCDFVPDLSIFPLLSTVRDKDSSLIAFDKMRELGMVGLPIEEVRSVVLNGSEKVTNATINLYKLNGLNPVLSETKSLNTAIAASDYLNLCFVRKKYVIPLFNIERYYWSLSADFRLETIRQFLKYDAKSNLLEMVGKNGIKTSYLWDYNGNNIIAVANNMSYDALMGIAGTVPNTTNEVSMMAYLQGLRSRLSAFPALLSTYTYQPLVGLTSATNPRGITTFYRYDPMGRLSHVLEKDNVLASYYYSYHNQIATEKYFGNAALTQMFTKACPSGDAGSSVTYTVPAGRYTSMISQADADAQAQADISSNGQNYANEKGTCFYLNPASLSTNFGKEGGTQTIQISCNTDWACSTDASWIQATSSTAHGNGIVRIVCNNNERAARKGFVFIKTPSDKGGIVRKISVEQLSGLIFSVDKTDFIFDASGQPEQYVIVTSSSPLELISSSNFISFGLLPIKFITNSPRQQKFSISCSQYNAFEDENKMGVDRTGYITISNGESKITLHVLQTTNYTPID